MRQSFWKILALSLSPFYSCTYFSNDANLTIEESLKRELSEAEKRIDLGYNRAIMIAMVKPGQASYFPTSVKEVDLTETTLFEIGSLTKLFTAHLTILLQHQGVLNLDEPIKNIVPAEWKIPSFEGCDITLRHLLTHSSGLSDPHSEEDYYNPSNGNTTPFADYTLHDLQAYLANFRLKEKPGTKTEYSNLGYGLIGFILEHITHKSYETLLQENILSPLQMNRTFIDVPSEYKLNLIQGSSGGMPVPSWQISTFHAFASLKSCAKDLTTYVNYLFFDSSDKSIKFDIFYPYFDETNIMFCTLGTWSKEQRFGKSFWIGSGKTLGFSSFIGVSEENQCGIIVITDSDGMGALGHRILNSRFPADKLYASTPGDFEGFTGNYIGHENMALSIHAYPDYLEVSENMKKPIRLYHLGNDTFFTKFIEYPQLLHISFNSKNELMFSIDDKQFSLVRE